MIWFDLIRYVVMWCDAIWCDLDLFGMKWKEWNRIELRNKHTARTRTGVADADFNRSTFIFVLIIWVSAREGSKGGREEGWEMWYTCTTKSSSSSSFFFFFNFFYPFDHYLLSCFIIIITCLRVILRYFRILPGNACYVELTYIVHSISYMLRANDWCLFLCIDVSLIWKC